MTNAQVLALLLPTPSPHGLPALAPFQLDPYSGFGQWVTYDQARKFVVYWNSLVPSMPILPGDDAALEPLSATIDAEAQGTSVSAPPTPPPNGYGIYKPFAVQAYFPEAKLGPNGVYYHWLAARFLDSQAKAVRAGLDIGLMVNQFYRYPYSSGLVISDLVGQILGMPGTPYQATT